MVRLRKNYSVRIVFACYGKKYDTHNGFDLEISQFDTPPDEACWLQAEI